MPETAEQVRNGVEEVAHVTDPNISHALKELPHLSLVTALHKSSHMEKSPGSLEEQQVGIVLDIDWAAVEESVESPHEVTLCNSAGLSVAV